MRQLTLAIAITAALLLTPAALSAQTAGAPQRSPGEVARISKEVSHEILSPFCPGKTLEMCPSGGAAEVRRTIQGLVREGKDKETVKQEILAKYGDQYKVVEPPVSDNVGLLIGLLLGLVICIIAVIAFTRRLKNPNPATPGDTTTPAPGGPDDEVANLSAADRAALEALREEYQS